MWDMRGRHEILSELSFPSCVVFDRVTLGLGVPPDVIQPTKRDAPPGRLYKKLGEEKGKRKKDKGLGSVLGKTKAKIAIPESCRAPVPV